MCLRRLHQHTKDVHIRNTIGMFDVGYSSIVHLYNDSKARHTHKNGTEEDGSNRTYFAHRKYAT